MSYDTLTLTDPTDDDFSVELRFDPDDSESSLSVEVEDCDGSALCWVTQEQAEQARDYLNKHYPVPATGPLVKASDVTFNEGVLRLAAVHDKPVTFRYVKSDTSPPEWRMFVPESVKTTSEGNLVVVGPDEDRGATRSFRLDRIRGATRSFRLDRIRGEVKFA